MAVERVPGGSSLIDLLDRVLDKGIVVDAWVRLSPVGIDLVTAGARVEVASIDTSLRYADGRGPGSRATLGEAGENGVRELDEVRPHAPRRRR